MSQFLHTSIRLNSDLRRAYNRFTKPEELEKWFAEKVEGSIEINEKILCYFKELSEVAVNIQFTALNFKESIRFYFPLELQENDAQIDSYEVEIKFMMCTSETEYCTEIHLMQYGFKDTEASRLIRQKHLEFWKEKLEKLRFLVNGNWVIKDSELTLRCLK